MAGRVCRTSWQMHVSTSDLGADLCPATETARGRHLASRRPIRDCGLRIPGGWYQSGSNPRERDVAYGYMCQPGLKAPLGLKTPYPRLRPADSGADGRQSGSNPRERDVAYGYMCQPGLKALRSSARRVSYSPMILINARFLRPPSNSP